MSIIDNISNRLFKQESVSSNIKTTNSNLHGRFSFNIKNNFIPYHKGREILKDSQVSTGYDILKYLLSSKQWILIANDNDEGNISYEFINSMLFNMETELQEVVKKSLTAMLWGFSCQELLYAINSNGRLIIKNIVPLHIKTLQNEPFQYNDNGELISIHQEYKSETVDIPVNKVLIYSFNANYDEDYGNGLLNDFKDIVEDKVNINNWLMTFLERHESPTLYGKTNDPRSRDAILDAFDDVKEGSNGIVVGENDELGTLESNHRGETFFKTLQYKDNQIFRRYYLGNLLLGDNSQTGTYAQSQTQLDFGQLVFDGILEEIANTIQKQIINPIIEYNFGSIETAPTISFDKFTHGDIHKLLTTMKPLIDSGVIDSENSTVQDSIGLLFKQETGLNYTNETPPIIEDFNSQEIIGEDATEITSNLLTTLTDVL